MARETQIGDRVLVNRDIARVCVAGDKGTILSVFYPVPNHPRSWWVRFDNGRDAYLYDDEFVNDEPAFHCRKVATRR